MSEYSVCERIKHCEFFSAEVKSAILKKRFQARYCLNCKEACARYMVAVEVGQNVVPARLYPNEYDRALAIMAAVKEAAGLD